MNSQLLLAQARPDFWSNQNVWVMIGLGILLLFGLFFILVFMSFLRLWIQCKLTGARIGILDLVGMKLRNVDYGLMVRQKIALVQAGVKASAIVDAEFVHPTFSEGMQSLVMRLSRYSL